MRVQGGTAADWRDAEAYAPLLDADRSLFAWEWLRREPAYVAAATASPFRCASAHALRFGLIAFEDPLLAVPLARPLWRRDIHPSVLQVDGGEYASPSPADQFSLRALDALATLVTSATGDHLLLSDGARALRLDGPVGTFGAGPRCLHYRLQGLASAEPPLATLRGFLALNRNGRFLRSLHPPEPKARRWALLLRTWDAICAGAGQRLIAEELLSAAAAEARWRIRDPSLRSRVQRLVRASRFLASGGYRTLLG